MKTPYAYQNTSRNKAEEEANNGKHNNVTLRQKQTIEEWVNMSNMRKMVIKSSFVQILVLSQGHENGQGLNIKMTMKRCRKINKKIASFEVKCGKCYAKV